MKKILTVLVFFKFILSVSAQEQLPQFNNEALISPDSINILEKTEYKLLVYGAINCSYSRYLIDNLIIFNDCKNLEIIILLNDSRDFILQEYSEIIKKYKVYSNEILKHSLKRNNDFTPQTFLFKEGEEILHVKGVKKKIFVKINNQIKCK